MTLSQIVMSGAQYDAPFRQSAGRHALDFTAGGAGKAAVGGAATLARIMFVTRKFIAGSGKDRGAWPWRAWAAFISA